MESKSAVTALGALAQETRLAIFRLLVEAGPEGLAAGAIAERLQVVPATLSFHLSQLATAGLVTSARHGRSIVYAADFEAMAALVDFLTRSCCNGRPELCAPAATGPRTARPTSRTSRTSPRPPPRPQQRPGRGTTDD